jgi:hypothetical protein
MFLLGEVRLKSNKRGSQETCCFKLHLMEVSCMVLNMVEMVESVVSSILFGVVKAVKQESLLLLDNDTWLSHSQEQQVYKCKLPPEGILEQLHK